MIGGTVGVGGISDFRFWISDWKRRLLNRKSEIANPKSKPRLLFVLGFLLWSAQAWASAGQSGVQPSYVVHEAGADRFPLTTAGQPVPLYVGAEDFAGVRRAAGDLQKDIERVTGAGAVPSARYSDNRLVSGR